MLDLASTGELPLPETLSALISARLDTLPHHHKALLGDAAVLGRIFWSGAVAALGGRDVDETRQSLVGLAAAGFVTRLPRSSIAGQAEYRFSHALVRDEAYGGWFYLADIVRACTALGELDRARRLIGTAEPALWRNRLQVHSAWAALAEAADDPAAVQLYSQAAAGWQQYGHVLEHGLALLGLGRCQYRAGDPAASGSMLAARAVFAKLGAVMPLSEADSWLGASDTRTA